MVSGIVTVLASGCNECHVCIVKDQDGVERYQYPEMCGNKNDISAYADQCEGDYGKFDYTCQCSESL
ncbi:MAG: hypothetical protein Salg2KO_22790 [Salibacteraceae bacterium]